MKVKLLVGRAGSNFSQAAGEIIEVNNDVGARMIEKGQAEPVVEKREKATKPKAEKR